MTKIKTIEKIDNNALKINGLYKSFGDNQVLNDFNLELKHGECVVVLGKSGAGKSVLIKCIIGLLKPDSGSICVFGENITEVNHGDLDKIRSKIGFLFQSNALYDSMTVRENLEFPLRRNTLTFAKDENERLVLSALDDVGLAHTIDMMPSELSGGMRKRIALARTLILKPEIILYDEPTSGLDTVTAKEIIQLMLQIQKKYNTSSLIISHDMNCVRLASNRVVILIEGKSYTIGTYSNLLKSTDPLIKQFFD